jgi:hypothetical protein
VLGSILSAVYRSRIGDHLGTVPPGQRAAVGDSVSATYGAAANLAAHGQPALAGRLIDAGNSAFIAAMHWAAWGSVAVAVIGVAVVLAWLPARSAPIGGPVTQSGRDAADLADTAVELAEV